MKWISRLVLVACLALLFEGYFEQRIVAYNHHSSASADETAGRKGWWERFNDGLMRLLYGPDHSGWLDASSRA